MLCSQKTWETAFKRKRLEELHAKMMVLRKENMELRQELKKTRDALGTIKCKLNNLQLYFFDTVNRRGH